MARTFGELERAQYIYRRVLDGKRVEGILIEGHAGRWSEIDRTVWGGIPVLLMESDKWGEDSEHVIIDVVGNTLANVAWNGWNDLPEDPTLADGLEYMNHDAASAFGFLVEKEG